MIWNVATCGSKPSAKLSIGSGRPCDVIYALAFSLDDEILVSGGGDGVMRQWNASTLKELKRTLLKDSEKSTSLSAIQALCFSPDGNSIAVESHQRTVIYDLDRQSWGQVLDERDVTSINSADFVASDNGMLVSGSMDGRVLFWDITGTPGSPGKTDSSPSPSRKRTPLRAIQVHAGVQMEDLAILRNGSVIVAAFHENAVLLTSPINHTTSQVEMPVTATAVGRVCASPDGSIIAVALKNESIQLLKV